MRFGRSRELKKTKIEIIPMIDTMFFLLVFFILSSVGVIKLQGIDINLPKAEASTPITPDKPPIDLTVAIDENQVIHVNTIVIAPGQSIGPTLRDEYLKQVPGGDVKQASVVISADPSVPHGTVVRCIDEARTVNINKFAIATQPGLAAPVPGGAAPVGTAPAAAPPGPATNP